MQEKPDYQIAVHNIVREQKDRLYALLRSALRDADVEYYERCFDLQEAGNRLVLVASCDGADSGFVLLNWAPKYPLFKRLGIPEIQDLFVLPDFRRRGVGAALLRHCEDLARARDLSDMGISVPLSSRYGTAQRLYIRNGYVPDGQGVTYDRETVPHGETRPIDDDLCLMMIKELS